MRYAVLGMLMLAGCGGSDSSAPVEDAAITGQWTFNESMSAASLSYIGTGAITLNGSTQFTGSMTEDAVLTGPGGTFSMSGGAQISGGQVDGSNVSFQAGTCDYTGRASGSPTNRIEGTVGCDIDIQGHALRFSGTWQAGR